MTQLTHPGYVPLSVLISFGGLATSLWIVGSLMTKFAQAKTLFLAHFTEDVFTQAVNSETKFDSKAEPLRALGA